MQTFGGSYEVMDTGCSTGSSEAMQTWCIVGLGVD